MLSSPLLFFAALLGALPAGFAATAAARRLSESTNPPLWAMILASAAVGLWAAFVMPTAWLFAIACGLGWALLVLATVDLLAFRLPDVLTLPLIATGLGVSLLLPDPDGFGHAVAAIIAAALFYAVAAAYQRVRNQEGLGFGDVKLAAAAGAWLGWQALPYVVLLACALGLIWVGVGMTRRGKAALQERIPFGTALCIAIWIIWLYGPPELFAPMI